MNSTKWLGMFAALCVLAAQPVFGAVKTYSHVFAPADLTIDRFGNTASGFVVDTTRAHIAGATSAGAGDEIHIIFKMAPGTALKFFPTGDEYFIEAMLWNSGGAVDTVSTSQINFAATNIKNQAGMLDYETPGLPSWRASIWADRSEFLTVPFQPGQLTEIHTSLTIPAGYPTVSFTEVYMNIGVYKTVSFLNPPPAQMMLQTVVPEPASLSLLAVGATLLLWRPILR